MDVRSKETQRYQIVCHLLYPSTPRNSEAESCRTETEPAEFSPFHTSKADGCLGSEWVSASCNTDLWARESQGAMRALFTLKEERQKQRIRLCFHLPLLSSLGYPPHALVGQDLCKTHADQWARQGFAERERGKKGRELQKTQGTWTSPPNAAIGGTKIEANKVVPDGLFYLNMPSLQHTNKIKNHVACWRFM